LRIPINLDTHSNLIWYTHSNESGTASPTVALSVGKFTQPEDSLFCLLVLCNGFLWRWRLFLCYSTIG